MKALKLRPLEERNRDSGGMYFPEAPQNETMWWSSPATFARFSTPQTDSLVNRATTSWNSNTLGSGGGWGGGLVMTSSASSMSFVAPTPHIITDLVGLLSDNIINLVSNRVRTDRVPLVTSLLTEKIRQDG